jgi:hypothetical protein
MIIFIVNIFLFYFYAINHIYLIICDLANELIRERLFLKVWVIYGKKLFKKGYLSI